MAQLQKPKIKNPELVAAMADFKQNQNKQTEAAMLEALKNASFIAPISLRTNLDEVTPDENGNRQVEASLLAVSNKAGTKLFPAFTDWLEFLKWKDDADAETTVITFEQYSDLLLRKNNGIKGIVINPAEANIVVQREKMAEMKGVEIPAENHPEHVITALFGAEKITNSDLIIAAAHVREEKSQEAQAALFNAIRKARFIAPAMMQEIPNEIKPGDQVTAKAEFIMLNRDDQKWLPLFTSLPELQKWSTGPSCQAVPMTLANYSAMMSDPNNSAVGIVIDPFTLGITFNKDQVLSLQPRLVLQDLKNIPMDMLNELKEKFAEIPSIKAAYLAGINVNGKDGHLIILDLTVTAQEDVKPIADATATIAGKFAPCTIAPLQSPMGMKASEGKAPFYTAEA